MNERISSPVPNAEISNEQMVAFIDRAKGVAPYDDQIIDQFGAYQTRIEHPDAEGYVSVYIPTAADLQSEDNFVDDTVRVIDRREHVLDNGTILVDTTTYGVNVTDMTTTYGHTQFAYDAETGQRVGPKAQTQSVNDLLQVYDMNQAIHGPAILTQERLREVVALLENLDPSRRF